LKKFFGSDFSSLRLHGVEQRESVKPRQIFFLSDVSWCAKGSPFPLSKSSCRRGRNFRGVCPTKSSTSFNSDFGAFSYLRLCFRVPVSSWFKGARSSPFRQMLWETIKW